MKTQPIALALSMVALSAGLAACNQDRNAPATSASNPPTISNQDSTPPVHSDTANPDHPTTAVGDTTLGSTASAANATDASGAKAVDDTWISTKVKTALVAESDLKAGNIDVDTKGGQVTLSGTVPSAAQSERATSVARGIDGVTKVENRLAVK